MSGWDSRLEKGPDGQKCRTCIYRAANRYGPWGCGYADVTGQSKLAAFPDAEPGTRAGRHCIVYQRGRAAKKQAPILPQKTKKQAPILPQKTKKPPAEPKPKRQENWTPWRSKAQIADERRALYDLGWTDGQIAARLGMSRETIKNGGSATGIRQTDGR